MSEELKTKLQESENITVSLDSTEPLKVEIVDSDDDKAKRAADENDFREQDNKWVDIHSRSFVARFLGMKKDSKCTKIISKILIGLLVIIGISLLIRHSIADIRQIYQIIKNK